MISDVDRIVLRLGERMARAEVVLFTGAGFSFGATDQSGTPIPQVTALRDEIWELTWPGEDVEPGATLADTYAAALSEGRNRLAALMRRRLMVAPESVTQAHCVWLSMPWRRAYTVNIDDLEWAAGRSCDLPRRIRPHSALAGQLPLGSGSELVYIHLNGTLDDVPDVTFTEPQYGGRQGRENPLYEQLAAELLSYPVISWARSFGSLFCGSTSRCGTSAVPEAFGRCGRSPILSRPSCLVTVGDCCATTTSRGSRRRRPNSLSKFSTDLRMRPTKGMRSSSSR